MRILFSAYCLINDVNGNSLIGVYKRCLRIGLEMQRRGHEVWVLCPERKSYADELTAEAGRRLHFLDLPPKIVYDVPVGLRRAYCRVVFRRLNPDMVVAGEAPLAGIIVESVLWAAGTGVPLVILDNAYGPERARQFVEVHGSIADGVALVGPSSFHMPDAPAHYCRVPPYIEGHEEEAHRLLAEAGLGHHPLITVLGYDRKAEELAAHLLPALGKQKRYRELPPRAVFLSPDPERCSQRLRERHALEHCLAILPLPGENLLFGLLKLSRLVIGKCGFMQMVECLSLGTPFIGVHYLGCTPLFLLPKEASAFVHAVSALDPGTVQADKFTVEAAVRFLQTPHEKIRKLHDRRFGGTRIVADFLENLPRSPRVETVFETASMGYTTALLKEALAARHPSTHIEIKTIRACRLRDLPWGHLDVVVCAYFSDGVFQIENLWGRVYHSPKDYQSEIATLSSAGPSREIFYVGRDLRIILERAGEEFHLPALTV